MAGFVLLGTVVINYVGTIFKLLVDGNMGDLAGMVSRILPLAWWGLSLSLVSPIVFVIFASIAFILIYLYKTSEVMNKKALMVLLGALIVILVLLNIVTIQKSPLSKVKFRLTIAPLLPGTDAGESDWMAEALWSMIGESLQQSVANRAIILPADWSAPVLRADSVQDLHYLARLNRRMRIEYVLTGVTHYDGGVPVLNYRLVHTGAGKIAVKGSQPLVASKLPEIAVAIRDSLLGYFHFQAKSLPSTVQYIAPRAYQSFLAGKRYFQQKDYATAIKLAEQTVAADSSFADACELIGKSYFMRGLELKKQGESPIEDFENARTWLTKAVALDSTCDEALAFLGEYYIYRERWSLAEQMLVKAYHLNPNNPRLYLSLSRLHPFRYEKLGFKNEEQLFRQALFIHPGYQDAYLMLADYYLFQNEREKAIETLNRMLKINPDSVPVLMALGKIYLVRNDILKIIEIYNRVLELEPRNSDAYYNLGILYYNSKDYQNAEKFLLRAVSIDNHLNAHLYLAYLYEINGDYDKAIAHLRQRIRYRKGLDDEFAEQARKHLFKLLHRDSTDIANGI